MSYIQAFSATTFRNIQSCCLEFSPAGAIFYGENGSGKTSVLEGLYYLGYGRSFRATTAKQVIQYNNAQFYLHAKILRQAQGIVIGLERTISGESVNKVTGIAQPTTADLAINLPMILINPDCYALLELGSLYRRQFLDWGLFHVEQSFYEEWLRFSRIVKQRNSLLKLKVSYNELAPWDIEYIRLSEKIARLRLNYFEQLLPLVIELTRGLMNIEDISLQYSPGWDDALQLGDVLKQVYEKDVERGYSYYGAQRADITVKMGKFLATQVLSRGQQKLFIIALRLAQGLLLRQLTGKSTIYLLDDLMSELDYRHLRWVFLWLSKMNSQIFITQLDNVRVAKMPYLEELSMFHVEQGKISIAVPKGEQLVQHGGICGYTQK